MKIINNLPQLLDVQKQLDDILTTHKTSGDHDSRYYTEAEMDGKLSGKSDTTHNHDSRYLQKSAVINSNTVTEAGYALDARQANPNVSGSLGAQINSLNRTFTTQISELNTNLKWSQWITINDNIRYRYNAYNIEVTFMYWTTAADYSGHQSIKIAQMNVGPSTYIKEFVFLRNTGSGNLHYYAGIDFTTDGGIYLVTMGSDIPMGTMLEAHFMLGR